LDDQETLKSRLPDDIGQDGELSKTVYNCNKLVFNRSVSNCRIGKCTDIEQAQKCFRIDLERANIHCFFFEIMSKCSKKTLDRLQK
jgi:hypothetical protein